MKRRLLWLYVVAPLGIPVVMLLAWAAGLLSFYRPWGVLGFAVLPVMGWLAVRSMAGLPPRVRALAFALRVVLVTLLVAALADLHWVQREDALAVIFVVDRSSSVPEGVRDGAVAYVGAAAEGKRPEDRAGMIVFGEKPSIEIPPSRVLEVGAVRSEVNSELTDISEALRLAMAAFPADTRRKIVLISDGNETMGDLLAVSRSVAGSGTRMDVLPIRYQYPDEVWVKRVHVPDRVNEEEQFDVRVSVRSLTANRGTLVIAREGVPVARKLVELRAGENTFVVTLDVAEKGVHTVSARILPERDQLAANNEARGHVQVAGQARVLLIAPTELDAQYLAEVCVAEGVAPDVVLPEEVVMAPAVLQGYDLLILANVEAGYFSDAEMEVIRGGVRDLGIGLVMVGGMNSFGMGNYRKTPVEDALPVEMDLKNKKVMPNGALIVLVDRSGSMSGEKLELAKPAAWAAIEVLSPGDYAGVIAFDGQPLWLVKPTKVEEERSAMRKQIFSLEAGGGTDIMVALSEAHSVLSGIDASLRHIILLSDGQSSHAGFDELISAMKRDRITVSSIGIGERGGQPLMQALAREGGGRFYYVDDPNALPQIFIREAMVVKRNLVFNEPFQPLLVRPHEVTKGLDPHAVPPLLAYIATSPKDTAEVPMVSDNENHDPIVATWRFGLGKSVAFTSDATSNWAQFWVEWEGFRKFWGQVVRWTMRQRSEDAFEVQTVMDGNRGTIVVDAVGDDGEFVNYLQLEGRIMNASRDGRPLSFRQVAPGRYEAQVEATEEGMNLLSIGYTDPRTGEQVFINGGLDVPHAPEYSRVEADVERLEAAAAMTGGRLLTGNAEVDAVFESDQPPHRTPRPAAALLLMVAIFLLFADIFVRRVIITREDLAALRERLLFWREGGQGAPSMQAVLKQKRREQRREKREAKAREREAPAPEAEPASPAMDVVFGDAVARPGKATKEPAAEPAKEAPPEARTGSYFGQLRQAKERARSKMKEDAEKKDSRHS